MEQPMNPKFKECLLEVYHAEQTGEIIFESMVRNAKNPTESFVFGSMLQLETEAKAIMRPTLVKLGLPIEENPDSRERGIQIGEVFKEIPYADLIKNIEKSVRDIYLPQYEELATLVTEEDLECFQLASFMGDHERALLLAAQNINNNTEDPIRPVTDMLRFPILFKG
tara:strand:- start:891 stop:1394 length:504 start_codon:yes stop_codon:yes gene_type:complete